MRRDVIALAVLFVLAGAAWATRSRLWTLAQPLIGISGISRTNAEYRVMKSDAGLSMPTTIRYGQDADPGMPVAAVRIILSRTDYGRVSRPWKSVVELTVQSVRIDARTVTEDQVRAYVADQGIPFSNAVAAATGIPPAWIVGTDLETQELRVRPGRDVQVWPSRALQALWASQARYLILASPIALALMLWGAWPRSLAALRRRARGRCPRCSYPGPGVCPECGLH